MPPFTADQLRAELRYDPATGVWTRLIARCNKVKVGDVAGTPDSHGYRQIRVFGRLYLASRLAVYYMTDVWPPNMVDHRDTDPSNDRWENLRDATCTQNQHNTGPRKNNKLGAKNVVQRDGRFRVRVTRGHKRVHVGYAGSLEEAQAMAAHAMQEAYGDFARV